MITETCSFHVAVATAVDDEGKYLADKEDQHICSIQNTLEITSSEKKTEDIIIRLNLFFMNERSSSAEKKMNLNSNWVFISKVCYE